MKNPKLFLHPHSSRQIHIIHELFHNLPLTTHMSIYVHPSPLITLTYFPGIPCIISFISRQNFSFSFSSHPTCGAYALITFKTFSSNTNFTVIILSLFLLTSFHLLVQYYSNPIPSNIPTRIYYFIVLSYLFYFLFFLLSFLNTTNVYFPFLQYFR
jgi:hypothetical protein